MRSPITEVVTHTISGRGIIVLKISIDGKASLVVMLKVEMKFFFVYYLCLQREMDTNITGVCFYKNKIEY